MAKKFIMMVGASGSGKSTLSRQLLAEMPNAVRVNRDELRLMALHKWRGKLEEYILEVETAAVKAAGKNGYHVIVDDTNLAPRTKRFWKEIAKQMGYDFEERLVPTPLEVCVARDAARKDHTHIGRPAIERQFLRGSLVDWKDYEVAIFDIDGTLADLEHRVPWITVGAWCPNCSDAGRPDYAPRGYAELPDGFDELINGNWTCKFCGNPGGDTVPEDVRKLTKKHHDMFYSLCEYDAPIDIVIKWAQEWFDPSPDKKRLLLIVSGRSPENGTSEATERWLKYNKVPYDHIYMRRAFHHGPDTDEKQLILNDLLASGLKKEQIKFVVDDRPSVIQMWRDNGLTVIPVRGRDDDAFYAEIQKSCDANPPSSWKETE